MFFFSCCCSYYHYYCKRFHFYLCNSLEVLTLCRALWFLAVVVVVTVVVIVSLFSLILHGQNVMSSLIYSLMIFRVFPIGNVTN